MKQNFFVQYESCECKCRLNEIVRNSKQKRNRVYVGVCVKN